MIIQTNFEANKPVVLDGIGAYKTTDEGLVGIGCLALLSFVSTRGDVITAAMTLDELSRLNVNIKSLVKSFKR